MRRIKTTTFLMFTLIIASRLFFWASYPGNIGGDAADYYRLAVDWRSALVHAHGYPFIMGAFYKTLLVPKKIMDIFGGDASNRNDKEHTKQIYNMDDKSYFILVKTVSDNLQEGSYASVNRSLSNLKGQRLSHNIIKSEINRVSGNKISVLVQEQILQDFESYYQQINARETLDLLILYQHAIDVVALIVLFILLSNVFNHGIAILTIAAYSLCPAFFGYCSITRPEWLQADLLIFTVFFIWKAYFCRPGKVKMAFYFLAFLSFLFVYLVKFNGLPLAILFVPLIYKELFKNKVSMLNLAVPFVMVSLVFAFYMVAFHKRTTGTYSQTGMKAWILTSLSPATKLIDPDNGLSSKRYYLLCAKAHEVFEQGDLELDFVTIYKNLNLENKALEANQWFYNEVMLMQAEEIERRYSSLIDNYDTYIKDGHLFHFAEAASLYGTIEIDRLATAVFIEAIKSKPVRYLKNVAHGIGSSFFVEPIRPIYPVFKSLGWGDREPPYAISRPSEDYLVGDGLFYFSRALNGENRAIRYFPPAFLKISGVTVFSIMAHFYLPLSFAWLLSVLLLIKLFFIPSGRSYNCNNVKYIVLWIVCILGVYIVATNIYHPIRVKELRLILHILCLFYAIGIYEAWLALKSGFSMFSTPNRP